MANNRIRALSEVVSVDGWHAAFDKEGKASVHVDLSFFKGLVGSEEEFAVTFRLALRRAVVRVVVPDSEPLAVMQGSVDREPTVEMIRKVISESTVGRSGRASIDAQLKDPFALNAAVSGELSGQRIKTYRTEGSEKISQFNIRQFKSPDGSYCWEISGQDGEALIGKVWNPVNQPRLSVKKKTDGPLEPSLRVSILCRRSDLLIEDVTPKKGSTAQTKFLLNRQAAAKAVIREKILKNGLEHPTSDNDIIEIQIADCLIVQEVI